MSDFFEFIRASFWHVSPILVASVVAVAIIVERTKALYSSYPIKDMDGFFERVGLLVAGGKIADAIAVCDKFPLKPAAQVTKQGLLRSHQPEELIESGLAIEVGKAAQIIQGRTAFLSTIANVATLFGLFGTIAGLIHSFQAVGHADAQQKSALLAAGISQAMNATMLGLAVAIPCMIAFALLANRTNRLIADVDGSAVRVLDVLRQRCYSAESEAVKNGHDRDEGADVQVRARARAA